MSFHLHKRKYNLIFLFGLITCLLHSQSAKVLINMTPNFISISFMSPIHEEINIMVPDLRIGSARFLTELQRVEVTAALTSEFERDDNGEHV